MATDRRGCRECQIIGRRGELCGWIKCCCRRGGSGDSFDFATGADGIAVSPWTAESYKVLDGRLPVVLLGTGLTMVDALIGLDSAGYHGPVIAVSRRGLVPRPHAPGAALTIAVQDIPVAAPISRQAAWLRALARQPSFNWRDLVDGVRPHVPTLWRAMSLQEQNRFLRHARPWWDVHRHRLAPEIGNWLRDMQRNGRLRVLAGALCSATPLPDGGFQLEVRRRSQSNERLVAARLIDCRGFTTAPLESANPVIQHLLQAGLAAPHPNGLGLRTSDDGFITGPEGRVTPWLRALGPVRRADLWESTAIPEIRAQAVRMAAEIATSFPK
jgi:uncharacterized NAD(P)/FAD-binding protein YdhS